MRRLRALRDWLRRRKLPRLTLGFDHDDGYKLLAVLFASAGVLWGAAVLGEAVRIFLALSGLR